MATASGAYHYGDSGDFVSFEVEIENDYPDSLNEARKTVVQALRELTGMEVPMEFDVDPDVI